MHLVKFSIFVLFVVSFFTLTIPLYIVEIYTSLSTRSIVAKLLSSHARACLWLFGIKVTENDLYDYRLTDSSFLIVANHLSYLDIIVIASIFPTYFITSLEMKATPFLGHICTMAQCLFVNRRSRANILKEISKISNKLKEGANVVLFPEATSTNGAEVIPFKKSLFQASIEANAPILPLCLNYQSIDGEQVTSENRDFVFWYGDMDFLSHFLNMLKCRRIHISASIGMPIEDIQNHDVKSLAAESYKFITSHYTKIDGPSKFIEASPVLPGNLVFETGTETYQKA